MGIETIDFNDAQTRMEEMHGKNNNDRNNLINPADGTKVGPQNKPEEDDLTKDKVKHIPSPTDFRNNLESALIPVKQYEERHPDAKAASEIAKTAAKTQEKLDRGMNSLYP